MDFLVNIAISVPPELAESELKSLIKAESARARELAEAGVLLRLWRSSGSWANWGLWQAEDRAALDRSLASLPLHPYMTVTVHPVEQHPNDPEA